MLVLVQLGGERLVRDTVSEIDTCHRQRRTWWSCSSSRGFFSGSEIALVNADKIKLNARANQGHRGAKLVLRQFQRPEVLLGTTLVGTNISTVILTTVGTLLMIRHFGERGDVLAFLVFTPLFLIFGEIVPKSVYQQKSDDIAPVVVYPLRAFSLLFSTPSSSSSRAPPGSPPAWWAYDRQGTHRS